MKEPLLQHFETFIKVAEYQSFSKAAAALGVSKAAVSHTIRILEESFKAGLFKRTTRSVRLTDEGELLLKQCLRLQDELVATRQLVAGFDSAPSGTLCISANPYLFESKLMPAIDEYRRCYPQVRLNLLMDERMPDMQAEGVDIVYGVNWTPPDDVVARKVGHTRYVFCASPAYLNNNGVPLHVKDLLQHQYIAHSGRSSEHILNDLKSKTVPAVRPVIAVNNAYNMKQLALSGLGIVQLHDYVVAAEVKKGTLIEVLSDQVNRVKFLYVFYQKHRFVQPKIRQFIRLLEKFKAIL